MKKKFLLFILLLEGVFFSNVYAGQQQEIPMQIINTGALGGGHTYAPPRPWYIVQDDYVLTLPALADDYTFELRDEEDEVVYTTFLPSGTTLAI